MLTMVFIVVPGGIAIMIWKSYRAARLRTSAGSSFAPSGKIRWDRKPS
jgi:hypothetical protein